MAENFLKFLSKTLVAATDTQAHLNLLKSCCGLFDKVIWMNMSVMNIKPAVKSTFSNGVRQEQHACQLQNIIELVINQLKLARSNQVFMTPSSNDIKSFTTNEKMCIAKHMLRACCTQTRLSFRKLKRTSENGTTHVCVYAYSKIRTSNAIYFVI